MRKTNRRRAILGAAGIILLAIIIWQVWELSTSAKPLSESDAKKIVEERYSGDIVDITYEKGVYKIIIQLEKGTYDVRIDRSTGDVLEIIRTVIPEEGKKEISKEDIEEIIEQKQKGRIKKLNRRQEGHQIYYDAIVENKDQKTSMTINAETGEVFNLKEEKLPPKKEVAKKLTEAEAIKIALDTVSGEVDDVDFEEEDGLIFYFVEIERGDDQEATIQINAITGEVMAITWDD